MQQKSARKYETLRPLAANEQSAQAKAEHTDQQIAVSISAMWSHGLQMWF